MINIVSTFYICKYGSHNDNERTEELITSLKKNIDSEIIEKIHLFVDDNDSLEKLKFVTNNSDKIIVIEIGKKPKYSDFFRYILDNLKNKICMICNSDIYLHEYNLDLLNILKEKKNLYVLTRYEYDMSHSLIDNYCGSHDCYIFNSSYLDENIINNHTNFYQNYPGIETQIIKSFYDCGFEPLNPCRQIKIIHLHKSNLRKHGEWIGLHNCGDDDYMKKNCWYVPPCVIQPLVS